MAVESLSFCTISADAADIAGVNANADIIVNIIVLTLILQIYYNLRIYVY